MRSKRTKLIHRQRRGLGDGRSHIEKLREAGEFKSVNGATADGIIVSSSELDQLKKHWRGATQTERDQFDAWIRDERRKNFWRSYRAS